MKIGNQSRQESTPRGIPFTASRTPSDERDVTTVVARRHLAMLLDDTPEFMYKTCQLHLPTLQSRDHQTLPSVTWWEHFQPALESIASMMVMVLASPTMSIATPSANGTTFQATLRSALTHARLFLSRRRCVV